uniref:Uncharacterized protein n=1 Tax=Anopheles farauti TaxID=69004 RepID=A0A182QB93_9DIPT
MPTMLSVFRAVTWFSTFARCSTTLVDMSSSALDTYGKEQLMIPLVVVLVVVVVEISPPGVVVREDRQQKQHDHRVAHLALQQQLHQMLGALVQRDHPDHDQQPHLHRVLRRVEVHVLVGGDTGFFCQKYHSTAIWAGGIRAGPRLPQAPGSHRNTSILIVTVSSEKERFGGASCEMSLLEKGRTFQCPLPRGTTPTIQRNFPRLCSLPAYRWPVVLVDALARWYVLTVLLGAAPVRGLATQQLLIMASVAHESRRTQHHSICSIRG